MNETEFLTFLKLQGFSLESRARDMQIVQCNWILHRLLCSLSDAQVHVFFAAIAMIGRCTASKQATWSWTLRTVSSSLISSALHGSLSWTALPTIYGMLSRNKRPILADILVQNGNVWLKHVRNKFLRVDSYDNSFWYIAWLVVIKALVMVNTIISLNNSRKGIVGNGRTTLITEW